MEELSAQWWNDDEEFEGPDCDSTMVCFFFFSDPCWIEFTTITRVDSGDIYIYL